ncbi:hypothetical protein ILUMI_05618 [Ignelater luminosus]|uniref:PNPLA domain-containing protein n=1 Tax=Ignelater luminosus TaxID=2038154 RepID=A0A8K0DBY4_IGNLU|nr:hypothetical protein ILUMI_05618 [Ignelater luminosus]
MKISMSLSKNIRHYRRCATITLRHYHSEGSNAVNSRKMQTRVMSLTQWKLLNQLKEYFYKFSQDKKFQNAVNKEIAQLLQKLQPSVYASEGVRFYDANANVRQSKSNDTSETKVEAQVENKVEHKEQSSGAYVFPNVLTGLKIKISPKEEEIKAVIPKWKNSTAVVSKSAILSRTSHVLSSMIAAESNESKLKRIEGLLEHIEQFPEVRSHVVKEGAIRLLLRVRQQTDDPDVHAVVNEAFAVLGYCNPLPGQGIRILSIDGGGIRGLLVIEMLRKLEELTNKKIHEMFDYVCGVSTGAIIACLIGVHQQDLDSIAQHYKEISTKVFNQSALWGTSSLVWSHSYYDTALWEKMLKEYLGEEVLIKTSRNPKCPKLAAISAIVNQSHVSAYVFRNYSLPWRVQSQYMGGHNHKVWEAVRASAAAPTYFEECKLGNLLHQDGGILVNNPTAVAIHEAKLLWPNYPIQCVVSFGTGRTVPSHLEMVNEQTSNSSSWKNKFLKILDSATDTEGVHTMLNDLLPGNVYFRFNPYLTEMLNMAEIDPKKLEQLQRDALMYLRRNEDKFQEAAKVLCQMKGPTQKALDWINLKRDVVGFTIK